MSTRGTTSGGRGAGSGSQQQQTGDDPIVTKLNVILATMATKEDVAEIQTLVSTMHGRLDTLAQQQTELTTRVVECEKVKEKIQQLVQLEELIKAKASKGTIDGLNVASNEKEQSKIAIFGLEEAEMEQSRSIYDQALAARSQADRILGDIMGMQSGMYQLVDAQRVGRPAAANSNPAAASSSNASRRTAAPRPLLLQVASPLQARMIMQRKADPAIKKKLHDENLYLADWLTREESEAKKKVQASEAYKQAREGGTRIWFRRAQPMVGKDIWRPSGAGA